MAQAMTGRLAVLTVTSSISAAFLLVLAALSLAGVPQVPVGAQEGGPKADPFGPLRFLATSVSPTRAVDPGFVRKAEEYMKNATESGLFMGAVLVAKNGEVLLASGYGKKSLEYDLPNTPQTKFDLASVGKTFTAALILLLQEDGKLKIEDSVCRYLDDCPDAWKEVSIRHLLTHTSGITNFTELPEQFEQRALPSFIRNAMKQIRKMPLQFKPGEMFRYSNTGYALLHEIAEKVSGKSYDELLQQRILLPLGMKNTGPFLVPGVRHPIIRNLAAGYTDGIGPLEVAPWVHPSYGGGSGLYSTAGDMYLWGEAMLKNKAVPEKVRERAFTPFKGNYGYGWFIFSESKHRVVMHGGNIPGFGITFALYPDDDVVVFVASNLDTAPTNRIHEDLVKILFGEKYELPPVWHSVAVDPKVYDAYVGRYQKTDNPNFVITITKEDNQLWDRLGDDTGAATMVLRPLSRTKFYNKMFVLFEVTFLMDDKGQVTGLLAKGPWGRGEFKRLGNSY